MTKMSYVELADAIMNGQYDAFLEKLSDVVFERRKNKRNTSAAIKFIDFNVGDPVVFNRTVRPAYLVGKSAKIVEKKRTKVVVELDKTVGSFRAGTPITCSTNIIDKKEK